MSKLWSLPLALAILAVLALPVAGLGTRAGLWHFRTGFVVLKWGAFVGIAAAVIALVMLVVPNVRRGNAVALGAALVLAVVAFGVPMSWKRKAKSVPAIHDITTDTENPPQFVAVLHLRQDAANTAIYGGRDVADAQKRAYPDVVPLTLSEPPASVFGRALAEAKRMGWEIDGADPATGRIEATDTTAFFGFKDDVVVRIAPQGAGSRVDVRSVSRVGKSDVGKNAERIRKFLAGLAP